MAIKHYSAIIERAGDGGFGVFFPDLPGCTSGGDTQQQAALNAAEALAMHLEGMAEHGYPVPEPSLLDSIVCEPDVEEAARLLVPAEPTSLAAGFDIGTDPAFAAQIDAAARARGLSRSTFLAEGARRLLASD